MGVASSKIDDDKALQLCRERKKYVRQALDERCALAAAHVAYIHSLKVTGTALRKFLQPGVPIESSLYTSTSATPEPLALTDKSVSHFSFPSPSVSQLADAYDHPSPSPPPSTSGQYQVHRMKFRGSFTKKVEEKPPVVVTGTVTSLSTPQNTTPSPSETPKYQQPETPPWDYFGLFHPIDNHFSSGEQREVMHGFGNNGDLNHLREDEEIPEPEKGDERISCHESQGSDSESEDEFDDPSSDTLVRSFKNLNREESHVATDASPTLPKVGSAASMNGLLNEERVNSPKLSPLKTKPSEATITTEANVTPVKEESIQNKSTDDAKATPAKEDGIEHKIAPKDLFSSMRDVEYLFVKASESGKEVPRMLEANKLHFRPLLPGQDPGASTTSNLLKACFSCGEDPSHVQEEPAQSSVKYLTWHRTTSFHSSSSMNPLGATRDDVEDLTSELFENFRMISGSHASTLDRLFAWEKKLYDEVKASQVVRRHYDMKCKFLREQESRCESQHKIDKTRACIKDLHSRIHVAIHRIDTISRRIEELRDKELEPQLEELIDGLRRMWEVMFECHKLQVHIITIAYSNNSKLSVQSDLHRQIAAHLEDELGNLASSFTKWINTLKTHIQAINDWLQKCVPDLEKSSKKRRWGPTPQQKLRNAGPPIYTTCGGWLDSLEKLPNKEVKDTIKGLAAEVSQFLPRQEKMQGRKTLEGADPELEMLTPHRGFEESSRGCDEFRSSLVIFLSQMSGFAECCVNMYGELQTNIEDAKRNYEHKMSQP